MKGLIQKKSLAEEVAASLEQQIASGDYKVGDKLPTEPELMKYFGVGRSSIREAVRILVNLGLLSVQQGVGSFVQRTQAVEPLDQRLKRADIKDLDEVRKMLELKIAEKAALLHNGEDLNNMKLHLAAREKAALAGDLEGAIQADIQFHTAVAVASRNEILLDLYKGVAMHMATWFKRVHNDTSSFVVTQALHLSLLNHIEKGEVNEALNTAIQIIEHD